MDNLLNHPMIDDLKTVSVKTYINHRKTHFPDVNDDFTALAPFKTMCVISISYDKQEVKWLKKGYGKTPRYSYGIDYHLIYNALFNELETELAKQGINAKGYADVSPIDERVAAELAGVGYIGKNQLLIHKTFGTYHFLGILLIDQELKTDPNPLDTCGECTKCIDACPPGALSEDGFNKHVCSSYVTQIKEPLSLTDVHYLKTKVFGCDICQKVCPKNADIFPVKRDTFEPDDHSQIDLKALLTMSNKAIQRLYKDYAYSYRGGLVLKRNAFALLYNHRQMDALPLMKTTYETYKHVPWFEETARMIIQEMEKKL
jgi:epoxyqueuosine reductase